MRPALCVLHLITLFCGLGAVASDAPHVSEQGRAVPVDWLKVERADSFRYRRELSGVVEATRSSAVGFEFGGTLALLQVDEGQRVSKGDLLARLDTQRLEAQRAELRASFEQVSADTALARQTLQRVQEAADLNAISEQALDEARFRLQSLEKRLHTIEASIERVQVELNKATLHAPYDAVVMGRLLDEGAVVGAGTPVLKLQEDGTFEIRVGIPKGVAIPNKTSASEWRAYSDWGDLAVQFKTALPFRDAVTRTVPAIFTTDTTDQLRPGDQVTFELWDDKAGSGFWLPQSALAESDRGLWSVYVLVATGEQQKLERRQVELVHLDSGQVFVNGALRDGERVVWAGIHKLVPNQLVSLGTQRQLEQDATRKVVTR